jgi:hypothetical protein
LSRHKGVLAWAISVGMGCPLFLGAENAEESSPARHQPGRLLAVRVGQGLQALGQVEVVIAPRLQVADAPLAHVGGLLQALRLGGRFCGLTDCVRPELASSLPGRSRPRTSSSSALARSSCLRPMNRSISWSARSNSRPGFPSANALRLLPGTPGIPAGRASRRSVSFAGPSGLRLLLRHPRHP